jgi:hypothetical protein
MLPVCGNPGIGTALPFTFTLGSAVATPGSARTARVRTARVRTARHVSALRIDFTPLSLDKPDSILFVATGRWARDFAPRANRNWETNSPPYG